MIFPADAGVNLITQAILTVLFDIPRGCGGEPERLLSFGDYETYSPRMRG